MSDEFEISAGLSLDADGDGKPDQCELLISECLGNTAGVDTEFIEIHNPTPTPINISGWQIELWDSDPGAIGQPDANSPYHLEPGSIVGTLDPLLVASPEVTAIYGIVPDQQLPDNGIESSSYTIVLRNPNGATIDSVFVTDGGNGDIANENGLPIQPAAHIGPDGGFLPPGFARVCDVGPALLTLEITVPAPTATPGQPNPCCGAPCDFDSDGDVDLPDVAQPQICYEGDGIPPLAPCQAQLDCDGDGDGDIGPDDADWAILRVNGPG